MIDLLFLILIVIVAYLAGYNFISLIKLRTNGRAEQRLYSLSAGLGLLSILILLLGFLGLLYPKIITGLIIVIAVSLVLFTSKSTYKNLFGPFNILDNSPLWMRAIVFITAIYMLYQLLNCMTPVINGDSIGQYLSIPKIFLQNHSILNRQLIEDYISSNLPLNLYMLSVLGISLHSEIVSQLILGWLMSVLIFLAIYVSIKRFTDKRIALLSAALFYTMPTMAWLIFSAKMDLGYVMFELCFWSLFLRWLINKDNKDLYISAIFLGFAIGSKYHSLIALTCVAIAIFIIKLVNKDKLWNIIKVIFLFSIISLLIGSPSYIKNMFLVGDPFYPFFSSYGLVQGEGFDIYKSLLDIPRFIYNMIIGKEFVNRPLYWADRPLGFLSILMFFLIDFKRIKENKQISFTIILYAIILSLAVMFSVWPFPRHILPAVALILILFAILNNNLILTKKFIPIGWVIVIMFAIQCIPNMGLKNTGSKVNYLIGKINKQEYLSKVLFDRPGSVHMNSGMLKYVSSLPDSSRILALDFGNGYYVDRPFLKKLYVYDENNIDEFIRKCNNDRFTHIYYSELGIKQYIESPKIIAHFVILKYKEKFLYNHYSSGNQQIYEIVYPNN